MSGPLAPSQEVIKAELEALAKDTEAIQEVLSNVVKKAATLYEEQHALKCRLAKNEAREKKLKIELTMSCEMMIDSVRWLPGFDLVTAEELRVLYDGQNLERLRSFTDWPYLVMELIDTRRVYPTWRLTVLERGGQVDTSPPYIHYHFHYIDTATKKAIVRFDTVRSTWKRKFEELDALHSATE